MSTVKGKYFENKACDYLIDNSFAIIEQNYYAKKIGEIDIVAIKDDVYHFIEVKSGEDFEAVYNITKSKLRKIINSVQYYLKVKKLNVVYCIDAIIFLAEEIEYLENITL